MKNKVLVLGIILSSCESSSDAFSRGRADGREDGLSKGYRSGGFDYFIDHIPILIAILLCLVLLAFIIMALRGYFLSRIDLNKSAVQLSTSKEQFSNQEINHNSIFELRGILKQVIAHKKTNITCLNDENWNYKMDKLSSNISREISRSITQYKKLVEDIITTSPMTNEGKTQFFKKHTQN